MARLLVSCINRGKRDTPHGRITNIGGLAYGVHWRHTVEEVIAAIENGVNTYFVDVNKFQSEVIVAEYLGHKYLKTEIDTTTTDNLLLLPSCSA